LAAVCSPHVDILAHPDFLTSEEVGWAVKTGIFIELTARKGHSLTNGHIALMTQANRANLLVSSDAHDSEDLLTPQLAASVALGSGITQSELAQILEVNPRALLQRLAI